MALRKHWCSLACGNIVPFPLKRKRPSWLGIIGHSLVNNLLYYAFVANLTTIMETRELREIACKVTMLMLQASAKASKKMKASPKNMSLRILSRLMRSLFKVHLFLQDVGSEQDGKIVQRLPILLKQLETVCSVSFSPRDMDG